jgi:adenylate cyclase
MKPLDILLSGLSLVKRYHYKWTLYIALWWTGIDALYWIKYKNIGTKKVEETFHATNLEVIWVRSPIIFVCSLFIAYYLIFKIRQVYRNSPRLLYISGKIGLFLLSVFVMNFFVHVAYALFIEHLTILNSIYYFYSHVHTTLLFLEHIIGWSILFILSHLLLEISEKYSPGVFLQILTGKYVNPKVEERIIMFMDMQSSTTIGEQLGSQKYFSFIRDFIYFLSIALLEFNGRIYQYVGDEVVVSWKYNETNARRTVAALVYAKRLFQRNRNYFMKRYGVVPEFKAGIHCGEITIGEIGIVKRDLVLSGDTMNTTARIKDACKEFDHLYIVSKDFLDKSEAKYNVEHLGEVELRGKTQTVDLYALLI